MWHGGPCYVHAAFSFIRELRIYRVVNPCHFMLALVITRPDNRFTTTIILIFANKLILFIIKHIIAHFDNLDLEENHHFNPVLTLYLVKAAKR